MQSRPANSQQPAPIDFPATSEVKLNGVNVIANMKGIKKKIGSAPPVDLTNVGKGTALNLSHGQNRVECIYVNTDKVRFFLSSLSKT
jgi:hypothetical protein